MTTLDLTQTVTDFIEGHPECFLILGEFDREPGSGGNLTLGEFCVFRRLDPIEIAKVMEDGEPMDSLLDERFIEKLKVSRLIDYILLAYHVPLQKEIPRLESLLAEAMRRDGEDHAELFEFLVAFKRFKRSLERHMEAEEKFFAFLKLLDSPERPALAPEQVGTLVRIIDREDGEIDSDLEWISRITRNYHVPRDGNEAYRDLLRDMNRMEIKFRRHEGIENDVLFPKVMSLIREDRARERPCGESEDL